MKNNKIILLFFIPLYFFSIINSIAEEFIFNVSEIEVTENGNLIKGLKRGKITTGDGLTLSANNFIYNKTSNILMANGNVKIDNPSSNYIIYSDQVSYNKNDEIITTKGKSKAINNDLSINAKEFYYNKKLNLLNASKNVIIENKSKGYIIFSENVTYFKNKEIIYFPEETIANINTKYKLISSNVYFDKNLMKLYSSDKGKIIRNNENQYTFENFNFLINDELLKAENVRIDENINKTKLNSDNFFFENGFFNLKNQNYIAGKTKINLKKNIFNIDENDPRLIGISSKKEDEITLINKGVFTSCKKNDNCPPWSIKANKITHNKKQRKIIYDDAILKVYDFPILYFPKFFHPDPSVERQSGFLKPTLNNSSILGSSIKIPYYNVISDNKDYTFTPAIFDQNGMFLLQNEYRSVEKNSSLSVDFNFLQNFKSSLSSTKNSINHFFLNFNKNLDFQDYKKSNLSIFAQKVSNNMYLKLFDGVLLADTSLWPSNNEILESGINLDLESENFNFSTGVKIYEDLNLRKSDSYQYIFPYYTFSKNLFSNDYGTINLNSNGDNTLANTNNLKTNVINNINFISKDFIENNYGFVNNYGFYLKNLNSLGKNDAIYKNSPQMLLASIFELNTSLPMIKTNKKSFSYLTPRISFKTNPGDMKNHNSDVRRIDVSNIFSIDRLGINDSFESGSSLTLGLNYENRNKKDSKKFFVFNLASSFRDQINDNIPISSSLNKKNSNLFANINYGINQDLKLEYDFALDNKIEDILYSNFGVEYSINNFITKFNYIEENDMVGDSHYIENISKIKLNSFNNLSFGVRKNQKINLTEYYDLVYEYKNDCLTAGVKYKKTYYEDRDIKPSEDLMFTITFFPITTFEQKVQQNLYRN